MQHGRKNIVVVDDEKEITSLYRDILESEYNVMELNQPEEFLKYLKFHDKAPFHALVTDFKMPRMNGMDMVTKAFALGFRFPFIMLSGHLDKETVIRAVEHGAFRLLEKPILPRVLYEAIDQIVIEHEIHETRAQVRLLISKIRENYTFLRIALLKYVPEEELNQMIVQTDSEGKVVTSQSFEELVQDLENRLDTLLATEKALEAVRYQGPMKTAV